MCCPGNQTILKACKQALLRETGAATMSNQQMRLLLERHGGCMNASYPDATYLFRLDKAPAVCNDEHSRLS